MVLTHVIAALVGVALGAIAHKLYAAWARRSHWDALNWHFQQNRRRANSMRKKPPFGRRLGYGRVHDFLRDFDV